MGYCIPNDKILPRGSPFGQFNRMVSALCMRFQLSQARSRWCLIPGPTTLVTI